jgi:hypothetical protein
LEGSQSIELAIPKLIPQQQDVLLRERLGCTVDPSQTGERRVWITHRNNLVRLIERLLTISKMEAEMPIVTDGRCNTNVRHRKGNDMGKIFWCPLSGDPTHEGDFGDIPGLKLEIPPHASGSEALLIFNLPQPYAEGAEFPGGAFRLIFDDESVVEGCFTYAMEKPPSFGRMPLTLTAKVKLAPNRPHRVEVHWAGIRHSKVHLGGSASLAALVE